jgi:bacterial/archaeal transporter family-2 protein
MQWLLAPVAILSGMLMVVQSACNGMLEKIIERPVTVTVVSLGVGITMLLLVGVVSGQLGFPTNGKTIQGPWWAWLGGFCGAMGAAMYVGLFVTASTVLSVIFDHFGWLGLSQHSAGIGRVLGCALMVIGIGLVSLF